MPKRTDLKSILIIGSGPIIIGQSCEFDYSGTQACKALRQEGYRIILINSNPATIMTDRELADATYLEPINVDAITNIIKKEKPDAILPTVGGQTALDITIKLDSLGILKKYNIELIGANIQSIQKAENRELFKKAMDKVGIDTAKGGFAKTKEASSKIMAVMNFPVIIRPSFTLGGTGGSIVYNIEEFNKLVELGLDASPISEILIEESLLGWKEFEMEVVRDSNDNAVIVCSIENVDPMGIHTGDSITVAPSQTLTNKEFQKMRDWSILCLRTIGVDTGGSNVQFAVNPNNGRMIIIEMNPRVSRSSALASKATGFPIAKIAAKLAVGYYLDELPNEITGKTVAAFEPTLDYVVTKVPRFDFEKFPSSNGILGIQMQSVGEVMAIGRTFKDSLQKAFQSLEVGLDGLQPKSTEYRTLDMSKMRFGTAFRLLKIKQAFDEGYTIEELNKQTGIDPWFLYHIEYLSSLGRCTEKLNPEILFFFKKEGFSDKQIGTQFNLSDLKIRELRNKYKILPTFKSVDTCSAEFKAKTPYCYSVYETEHEIKPLQGKKIMILGSGPTRIGQGVEFDYCCVQAALGLKEINYQTIMYNCNPETVSTDFDVSDRLYFEPLTFEHVMNVIDFEKPDGVLIQFGGQTPLNIANQLKSHGVKIIGTDSSAIDLAEDRKKFGGVLKKLKIPAPKWGTAYSIEEALSIAEKINYPVLVRPSYVLGGRGMEIVYDNDSLKKYVTKAALVSGEHPILIDDFLENAYEFDVDALCDGESVYVAGIMQHIEEAGIHSGDSACVLPPYELSINDKNKIKEYTRVLALELQTVGLINIQFAIQNQTVSVLEVNPRASRTIPFVSKVKDIPLAKIAAQLTVGEKLKNYNLDKKINRGLVAVKKPVFPFNKFPNQSIFLSPEMKSTGEVIGLDTHLGSAYAKAEYGAGNSIPLKGNIFISVNDFDKMKVIPIARDFDELGYKLIATEGTQKLLTQNGINCKIISKVGEGRPNVVDYIKNKEIQFIINTPLGQKSRYDEYEIGRSAIRYNISATTTISGAQAALRAVRRIKNNKLNYRSLQNIFESN